MDRAQRGIEKRQCGAPAREIGGDLGVATIGPGCPLARPDAPAGARTDAAEEILVLQTVECGEEVAPLLLRDGDCLVERNAGEWVWRGGVARFRRSLVD